ncbi:MAG: hypothetical protein IIY93_12210 [Clostridia bacterium]|nr:hypothetical protein [Clostridia bacterium]MBQ1413937.1 hypothetical protein [Clostridia bacterium]
MKKRLAMMLAMALVIASVVSCKAADNQVIDDGGDTSVVEVAVDEDLANIIKEASEIGEGTAGVSLKRTKIAHDIAVLAANRGYTDEAIGSLKDDFYAMVEPMDEEHQASFHAAFMEGVIALLDKAIDEGDYDSVKGQFEDAGVADDMDTILRAPGLKESYGAIKSAYLTMGNSED